MTNVIPFRTDAAAHRASGFGDSVVSAAAPRCGHGDGTVIRTAPTASQSRSATANDDAPRDFASAMRAVEREIYQTAAPFLDHNDGLRHLIR